MKSCLYRYITGRIGLPEQYHMGHNAEWTSYMIWKLIKSMGYETSLINWNDREFEIQHTYDLVFDVIYLPELRDAIDENTVKIFLLTGSDNVKRNQRGLQRVADLNARRGCDLKYYRYIPDPEKVYESIELADHVLFRGNEESKHTYPEQYWDKINLINVTAANAWGLV